MLYINYIVVKCSNVIALKTFEKYQKISSILLIMPCFIIFLSVTIVASIITCAYVCSYIHISGWRNMYNLITFASCISTSTHCQSCRHRCVVSSALNVFRRSQFAIVRCFNSCFCKRYRLCGFHF